TDAAFYYIATAVGGDWLKWMLALPGVLFAGLPSALAAQVATARLMYSMSRDGSLPRALGHISAKRKVPDRAILFIAAVTLVLGVLAANAVDLLVSIVNFGALTGFLILHVSVVAYMLRKRRFFSGFGNVFLAVVGFAIIAYVLFNLAEDAKIIGLVWLAAGVAVLAFIKPSAHAR